jgi:hypothetical protein
MSTRTEAVSFTRDAPAVIAEHEQQLRDALTEAGLSYEVEVVVREFKRDAQAVRRAIQQARPQPLAHEQGNPASEMEWLGALHALIGATQQALVQEAEARAARALANAQQRVGLWRKQRGGLRGAMSVRYELPSPVAGSSVSGNAWQDT